MKSIHEFKSIVPKISSITVSQWINQLNKKMSQLDYESIFYIDRNEAIH